ncbi:Uncharacterised protein [Salmonella bongori]|nr:Uncharacterised protein [Salmonella bongori]
MGFAALISLLAQLHDDCVPRQEESLILYRDLNHIKSPTPRAAKPLTGAADRLNRHTTTH